MDFKSLFSVGTLKKLTNPQASKDLNVFLEKLPQNAGHPVLIAAGIAWGFAAAAGLITMVKVQELTELRAELKESQAITPAIPSIKETAVNQDQIKSFVTEFQNNYGGLEVKQSGSNIMITSTRTTNFGEFREAIGHVYNGGVGWRVGLDKLCVGRECDQKHKLAVALSLKQVSVENANK